MIWFLSFLFMLIALVLFFRALRRHFDRWQDGAAKGDPLFDVDDDD